MANLVHVAGEVDHLVGEAPLVVVPSDELDEVVVQSDTIAITGVSTIVCYAGASMLTNIITGMGPGMILAMSHVPVAIILNCIAIMWIAPFFDRKSGYAA